MPAIIPQHTKQGLAYYVRPMRGNADQAFMIKAYDPHNRKQISLTIEAASLADAWAIAEKLDWTVIK